MIQAAPLVLSFARAVPMLNKLVGAVGITELGNRVNNYIQENPEESAKIVSMIMPAQGIANALKNKSSEDVEEVEETEEVTTGSGVEERIREILREAGVEDADNQDLTDLPKDLEAKVMSGIAKSSTDRKKDMKEASAIIGLSGPGRERKKMIDEVAERYDEGGIEEITKPKYEGYKKFIRRRKADGGAIGIEVLFGPKVPAAPSQLVSESDILLGYRGDAAYRSGSEQSKSIGQGNVGSKASFGGGQGRDRSGRSEGAGGVNPNQYTSKQQNVNQIKANLGIKDPNLLQKTFNKYNSLPIGVKGAINTMAPVELMKLFNIGNALNTGYDQIKRPVLTDEDILLEPSALPELTLGMTPQVPTNMQVAELSQKQLDFLNSPKIQRDLKEFGRDPKAVFDMLPNYEEKPFFGTNQEPTTPQEYNEYLDSIGVPRMTAADGGRVGLFMGGSPLDGQALSIYNSMNAYGFSDQEIANALQEQGLYDPNASTPDTTPDTGQTIGYQGGDGAPASLFGKNLNPTFSKDLSEDPRFNYLEPTAQANKYRFDRSVEPREGLMGFFDKVGNKFKESKFFQPRIKGTLGDRRLKAYNNPMLPSIFGALGRKMSPFNPDSRNYNPDMATQLNFLEMGQLGDQSGLSLLGRDPGSGLMKYGSDSVLAGKNVISGFGTNNYETALRNFISRMNANTRISDTRKAARLAAAQKELEAAQAAKAAAEKSAMERVREQQAIDEAAYRNQPGQYGGDNRQQEREEAGPGYSGSGTAAEMGSFARGGRVEYKDGGLATMFTRKR